MSRYLTPEDNPLFREHEDDGRPFPTRNARGLSTESLWLVRALMETAVEYRRQGLAWRAKGFRDLERDCMGQYRAYASAGKMSAAFLRKDRLK